MRCLPATDPHGDETMSSGVRNVENSLNRCDVFDSERMEGEVRRHSMVKTLR
jgi:hypothetical protein